MPTIKFDDIKTPEPVPAGNYLAEIIHGEEAVSKAGNEMIKLRWQVQMDDDGDDEHQGRIVFDNLVFAFSSESDVPLQRIKSCMTACGWDADYDGEVTGEDFVGKVAKIGVGIRQSSGVNEATGEPYPPQNNVRNYKPMTEDEWEMVGISG